MHFLSHWLGLDDASGSIYLLWSGFVGDLGYLAIVTAIVRKHNCHSKRCWRMGRFPVEGTPFTVCRRCHPHDHQTAEDIRRAWTAANPEAPFHKLWSDLKQERKSQ